MEGFDLCITHGNGPQIGQLALQVILLPHRSAACLHRVQYGVVCSILRVLSRGSGIFVADQLAEFL
jgi:hypothetical protein